MSDADERDFPLPEEDTAVYRLYTLEEDENLLSKLAADCNHHAQSITRNHIWHYDQFTLEVCAGKKGGEWELPLNRSNNYCTSLNVVAHLEMENANIN